MISQEPGLVFLVHDVDVWVRVSKVVVDHDSLLTQWRVQAKLKFSCICPVGCCSLAETANMTPKRNWQNAPLCSSLQKSEFLKLIISFFHYFWCQNWDQWHKMSWKNTHICFFLFLFKNKQVWAEIIWKKWKNSKNLKVASNYPNI
jgi:hypothetical protein